MINLELNSEVFGLKPTFNRSAHLIKAFGTLAIVLTFFTSWLQPEREILLRFIIIFSSIVLTPSLLLMLYTLSYYAKQEYIIREDGISSINSFMGYAKKDLSYLEVREVQLSQTFFQKMFGLGSVYISTNAISFDAGLAFFDIRDSEAIYHEIQKRVALAKELEKKKNSNKA